MTSSILQHNSPTRGWVTCTATKRACRFGDSSHRTVLVSPNLEKYYVEIEAKAADGVIDAQETKDLSKSIADDILSPKEKQEATDATFTPTPMPENIPMVEDEPYDSTNLDSTNLDSNKASLNEARVQLNEAAKVLNYTAKQDAEFVNRVTRLRFELEEKLQSFHPKNLEAMNANGPDGAFGNDSRSEAEMKAYERVREDVAYADAQLSTKNRFNIDTAKENYSRRKADYDRRNIYTKQDEAKTVLLNNVQKSYFEAAHSFGPKLTVHSYNEVVKELANRPEISEKEKIKNIAQLRGELIETAKANYKASRPGSVARKIDKLFQKMRDEGKIYTPEQEAEVFEKDTIKYKATGQALSSFAKNLKQAPWDAIIK